MLGWQLKRCGQCDLPFDMTLFGVSTELGPSEIICRRCGESINTGRTEWRRFGPRQHLRFVALSVASVIFGGWVGGKVLYTAEQHWLGSIEAKSVSVDDPEFKKFGLWAVIFVGGVLLSKVLWSNSRTERRLAPALREGIFRPNFIFGAQAKIILILLLPELIGWLKVRFF